jgi:hypothetical protein
MSDGIDIVSGGILAGGLPVYTVVKECTEKGFKKLGCGDADAEMVGRVWGACASVVTTLFAGTP